MKIINMTLVEKIYIRTVYFDYFHVSNGTEYSAWEEFDGSYEEAIKQEEARKKSFSCREIAKFYYTIDGTFFAKDEEVKIY